VTPFKDRKVKDQGHQVDERRDRKSAISSEREDLRTSKMLVAYANGIVRPRSPTCAVTSNLKAVSDCLSHPYGQGHIVAAQNKAITANLNLTVKTFALHQYQTLDVTECSSDFS